MDALRVEGLEVTLGDGRSILHGLDMRLASGEVLGLTGASGAGKTTLACAVCGLLPEPARCVAGRLRLLGRELDPRREASWRGVRGKGVLPLFQDASSALNPSLKIGAQIAEAVTAVHGLTARPARRAALEALEKVSLSPLCADAYPHALSGGMLQRVPIALAMALRPAILVADEPTTALDAIHKRAILDLLLHLRDTMGTALLLVSHDLALLAAVADRLAVLAGGTIVEEGAPGRILRHPGHAESARLVQALAALEAGRA